MVQVIARHTVQSSTRRSCRRSTVSALGTLFLEIAREQVGGADRGVMFDVAAAGPGTGEPANPESS